MGAYSRGMTAGRISAWFGNNMQDLILAWEGDYPLNHQPPDDDNFNVYSIIGWVVSRMTTLQKRAAENEINRVKANLVDDPDMTEELNHFLDDSDVIFLLNMDDPTLTLYNAGKLPF